MMYDLSRRGLIASAAITIPSLALAQGKPQFGPEPNVLTGRSFEPGTAPSVYPDPDILILAPSGAGLFVGHSFIKPVKAGFQWAEGPAWSNMGQYVVFSDVAADIQYRYIW